MLNSTIRPSVQIALAKCVRSEKSLLFAFRRICCAVFKGIVHAKMKYIVFVKGVIALGNTIKAPSVLHLSVLST